MKKFSLFVGALLCALVVCLSMPGSAKAESAKFTDNKDGTVTMTYNNENTVRVRLVVQLDKDKAQYKYDIPKGECEINIPLTKGNGKYKLILCKNSSGTKYSVMQQEAVTLELDNEDSAFLVSSYIVDWNTTNDAIKKAQSLTKKSKSDKDKLSAIYKYIVQNYSYDYDKAANIESLSKDMAYIPVIDDVYADKDGICYDISILFASMLRSVEIPAKVVTGYTPNATTYHAWNNVYYSPKKDWKVIDATYDLQMYQAGIKYEMFKKEKDYSDVVYTY